MRKLVLIPPWAVVACGDSSGTPGGGIPASDVQAAIADAVCELVARCELPAEDNGFGLF